ncbi:MAG: hypothetical protein US50_C0024G0012 [Candidatus Nomurabacteria bacterium GW2011_GWB1_37_5]|uniref:Membrane protein 6-pyruvoyl-tetrahydropterin synthase-related domain-containing protein n=1 Tax=Candidatus Nomurabacteria bacterium GW2011_GWB1_37_5 TaxID=1618742 RepID=A0A0G0GVX4_9BACT|nr:MAG: hypothetical protein US50_C0024G0012 [Candidatus Nomurabacteria bacterium GW2011_GWB1_37_5]
MFKRVNPYHFYALLILALVAAMVTLTNLGVTKEFIGDDAGVGYHYSETLAKYASSMWDSYAFPGRSNVISTIGLINIGLIRVLNQIGLTPIVVDRLYYFLAYFVSGTGLYFFSSSLYGIFFASNTKRAWIGSVTGGLLYMLNNFTMVLLSFPPTSYVYSYMLLPWMFLLYLKDFHIGDKLWKKIVFSILFLLFLSGNPSNTISIVFLLLIYELFFREDNRIFKRWKQFAPTIFIILLISTYIYLPVLGNKVNPYGVVSDSANRISIQFSSATTSLSNLLRMRGHHSQESFVFNDFLLSHYAIITNYLLMLVGLLFLLKNKIKRIEIFFALTFLFYLFLSKAEHIPFSWINELIYSRVPLFEMYRASYFKFMYICTFSLSILVSFSLLEIDKLFVRFPLLSPLRKVIIVLPIIFILVGAKPFFFGEVVRAIHKTTIPIEYHTLKTDFDIKKVDFSVLSLPQLPSGQVLDWGSGNYYGGFAHADMFMLGRPTWSNGWFLSNAILSNDLADYREILSTSSIKYIILHKDVPEKYSFQIGMKGDPKGRTNYNRLNKQISMDENYRLVSDTRFFRIFEVNNFLPHIHVTKYTIDSGTQAPVLEFKKINSSKYRVVVHKALGKFSLVLSESFNKGWRAYPSKLVPSSNTQTSSYKILDGNIEDQVDEEELRTFIDSGWITTLGDSKEKEINHQKWAENKERSDYIEKYNIDFISKNFLNTIQNDNLQDGSIFETLFKKPMSDDSHYQVDTYSNVWTIDTNKMCGPDSLTNEADTIKCIKNSDGSYDFEVVIEFWPQRLFYLGLIISGTSLIGLLVYVFISRRKGL